LWPRDRLFRLDARRLDDRPPLDLGFLIDAERLGRLLLAWWNYKALFQEFLTYGWIVVYSSNGGGVEPAEPISSGTISASPGARPSRSASTSAGRGRPQAQAPGEEINVLEGTLEYNMKSRASRRCSRLDVGSVNAAELATYIVEKGKPLVELVK
jgi:hypothetical protein